MIALLTISALTALAPLAFATVTERPTVYNDDGIVDPLPVVAGSDVYINTENMTITGAQIWLWLSTHGGSEIDVALGDRPYAGPFLLSDLVGPSSTPMSFNPAQVGSLCDPLDAVDSPFEMEDRDYSYILGNDWINGTIPLFVQGEDVDYWIKIADVSPNEVIAGSEIGVSTNRINFLPGFFASPLSGAPDAPVTVSGYALPSTETYTVTQNATDVPLVINSEQLNITVQTYTLTGWDYTGFSTTFHVIDLENNTPGAGPTFTEDVQIIVWQDDPFGNLTSFDYMQYYREVYVEEGSFRGHEVDYSGALDLSTGSTYVIDVEYFPASGVASVYIGGMMVNSGMGLNGTGGAMGTFTVPAMTTGNYLFQVIDNFGVEYNFTVHVTMVPYITCEPDEGYVGDAFNITGVNFLDYIGDYVTLYFENSAESPYYTMLANFTCTNSTWSWEFEVPESWGGWRMVEARIVDGTTVIADDMFNVWPMLNVIPDIIDNDCSVVPVEGHGFDGDMGYSFYIDNSVYIGDMAWGWMINPTGEIYTEFVAAGFRPGRHEVHVIGITEGTMNWDVFAKDCFNVSTLDDPIGGINLTAIDAQLMNISGDIATLSTTLGTITTTLTSIDARITSIEGPIATLSSTAGTLQTTVSSLSSTISGLDGDIATITTSLGTIETSLDSIDATVSGLDGDIATIQTSVGTLEGTVTDIEDGMATIETDLGTVQLSVESVQADVEDNLPVEVDMTPVWIAVVLSLVAALSAIFAVITIRSKIAG